MNKKVVASLRNVFDGIMVFMLFVGTTVYALPSNGVTYDNSTSGSSATNVGDAIDDLYSKLSIKDNEINRLKGIGNASSNNILSGYTALVQGNTVTGSIQSKGATTYTPGTQNQTIASNQYLSGNQTIKGDANLVSGNIAAGKSIFGVNGTYTNDANAAAGDIVKGKTAYIKGQKITGTRTAQNNSYGVKKYDFHQLGGGQTCSFSYNFTPTVAGKLIVYMTATRSESGVNSAWGTKFVKVANNNINSTGGSVDAWQGKYYWVTNVSANQAVNISTSIAGAGTSLTSCSLFVMYVQ